MDRAEASKTVEAPLARSARGWAIILSPLLAVILAFAIVAALTIATTLVIRPTPSQAELQRWARTALTSYSGQMALTMVVYAGALLAMWLLLPKRGPAALKSYFGKFSGGTFLPALASGAVFAFCVGVSFTLLSRYRFVNFEENTSERALIPHSFSQLGVALLAVAVVGPFVEEIYFRGLLLRWLRERMPLWLAAIPNALFFAATHFRFASHVGAEGWVLTGALFVFGLFAVAWASATRSLWPAIAAHGMYNATLISAPLIAGQSS